MDTHASCVPAGLRRESKGKSSERVSLLLCIEVQQRVSSSECRHLKRHLVTAMNPTSESTEFTLEICIAYRCMPSVIITSHTHGRRIHHTPHRTTPDWHDQTPTLFSLHTKVCRMLKSRKLYLEIRPPPSCPSPRRMRVASHSYCVGLLMCASFSCSACPHLAFDKVAFESQQR